MRKFIYIFLTIVISFVLSGCGSELTNLNLHHKSSQNAEYTLKVKQPIVVIVKHTKNNEWIPSEMFPKASSASRGETALLWNLLSSHNEKLPFVFEGNSFYIWGNGCGILKKDGQACNCTRIKGNDPICKYDTPFCDNGFMGFRIKPGGVVNFNKEKTIAYFKKYHVLEKVKLFDEIISYNKKQSLFLEKTAKKELRNFKAKIKKLLSDYKRKKPRFKFLVLNNDLKRVDFNSKKLGYGYYFSGLEYYLSNLNYNSEGFIFDGVKFEFPEPPKLKIAYDFTANSLYIYIPNEKHPKKFNINDFEKIKKFINDYYENVKQKNIYLNEIKNKEKEILNKMKQKMKYVFVSRFGPMCTKGRPCFTKKGIYEIVYYFENVKPNDKFYLNKINVIKVNGFKKLLNNAFVNKPNIIFEDKNLAINVQNNQIHLINKTKNFIKIRSLAEYIKDKIYKLAENYLLPPEADKIIESPYKIYVHSIDEKIFYGFAIDYEINGKEYNFYQHKTFSVKKLSE
jgi:hypothetical protein